MKYRLGDLTVKNWNDWDRVPRDPVSIGTAIASAIGVTSVVGTYVVIGLTYVAVSAVTSWAISALAPKPDFSSFGSQGTLVNARDPAAAADFIYGEVRKGGTVTFYESTGEENKYLHQVIALAGHEVNSIGDIYINDEVVSWNASTGLVSGDWDNKIRIRKYLGDQTTADPELVSETSATSSFVGYEIAYLYVRYEYDQDVFANGLPLITAKIQGKKVLDPRTGTTAYSNNAALCMRDFLVSEYGLNDSAIDDVSFSVAANESDENVALAAGGFEKRYTINGIVKASSPIGKVLGDMSTACAGTLFWGSGYWKLKVGAYSSPVKTLTLDDLRGPISMKTRTSMRDSFNGVSGTFNDSEQDFITADYPSIKSETFKAEDGGDELMLDLPLPYTTSASAAQRLAKLTLYRAREQISISADFGLNAFDIEVGDIIAFDNDRYGFDGKEFEVMGWRFESNQDAGDLRVNLTLQETSASAFDWNAEETALISNNTTLPSYKVVSAPSNLTLTSTAVLNDDGITIPAIKATWDVSANAFVQYYEIQYKRLGGEEDYGSIADAQDEAEEWGAITVAADLTEDYGLTNEEVLTPDDNYSSVFGSSNSFTIEPVLNGYDYQVRVRAISALGVRSPFATAALASEGDTTPPNEPLSLSAVGGSKYITVSWTNPADQDLDYVEVWENATNNLNTATQIGTSSSTNFMRPNLENNVTRYYWVRAVDYSLNKSEFTSSVNATTLLITPNDFNDAVNDLFQEAGAFGIEPVQTLPATGDFDGQLVLLLPDITIYRWDDATSAWSTDIFTASSVEAGSLTYASFASGIEPVGVVSALPTVAGYIGPQVVVLTTDGKLYRLVDDEWTAAVNTDDITGTIGENLFSDDLRPIERVAALPSTGLTQGRVVLLTSDNKLYRYTGSAWTSAVPAADLTGQLSGTQIADAAVTASKIGAAAVTNAKLASEAVTADIIAADAITETKIASDAVTTAKIAAGSIVTSKIAAGAVTADEITSGAVTTAKIAAGAVTADEIAANAITSGKIAANTITADDIAANAITASEISAGAVSADKIAANAVTASKIAADAVTADKVAANAITAGAIAADAVTAGTVAAGAISADQLAANAVTADKIFANAVTADKVATDAITANKIAASSIISSKIAAGAVTADKISVSELSAISADLGTIEVDTANIADGAISSAKIEDAAITNAKIASLDATKITTGTLSADRVSIDGATLDTNASGQLIVSANGITRTNLEDGSVSGVDSNTQALLLVAFGGAVSYSTAWSVGAVSPLELHFVGWSLELFKANSNYWGYARIERRVKNGSTWGSWSTLQEYDAINQVANSFTGDIYAGGEVLAGNFADVQYRVAGRMLNSGSAPSSAYLIQDIYMNFYQVFK
jgi:hypothetical protein